MDNTRKSFSSNNQAGANDFLKFPSVADKARLDRYAMNDKLFKGDHFGAFSLRINDPKWSKEYYILKYVAANFAGLISKVCADMLFSEPIQIDTDNGDQDFLDGLIAQNKLNTQFYESALANSRHGDAVFKIRSGYLNPGDESPTVIIEDISPSTYFPVLNAWNIRDIPARQEIAWLMSRGSVQYLRKEIHEGSTITNELWVMDGDQLKEQVDLSVLGDAAPAETQDTGIPQSLIVHVPNWRDGSTYYGYDDYQDLMSLFYAINNRMTKGENILDKHSDPILALPEGVLDEQGKVRKESFHMFEIPSDGVGTPVKPEYITWNASLEPAFKQIEKLVEMLYMFSETSPDAFGMGTGQSDSGRALKYKMMRTIAKVARKKLYYDSAIKQVLFVAQKFAQANNIPLQDGVTKLKKDPVLPEIIWSDGLPIDDREIIENEEMRLASGTQTVVDAIKNIDNIDEDAAVKKAAAILAESAISVPTSAHAKDPANNDITASAASMVAAGVPANDNKGKQIAQVKLPQIDIARTQRLPTKGA
jgi:hypothetical protein